VVSSQPGDSWPPQQISGDGACIARNPPADGAVVRAWFAVLPHNPAGFARFGRATSLEAVWRIAGAGGRNRFAAGPNPFSMEHPNPMPSLRTAYDDFVASVLSIPEARFLASMDGWAPRDVVAHLIGGEEFLLSVRPGEVRLCPGMPVPLSVWLGPAGPSKRTSALAGARGANEKSLGDGLLSQAVAGQVPSALAGLTTGFGMGPGVPPPL
jgi:hypothetical protein